MQFQQLRLDVCKDVRYEGRADRGEFNGLRRLRVKRCESGWEVEEARQGEKIWEGLGDGLW